MAKTKEEAKAEAEARAKVQEKEAQTKAEEGTRSKVEAEAESARAKAEEEARAKTEQEPRAKAEGEFANFQEFGKEQLQSVVPAAAFLTTSFQAIAADSTNYSKRSLENGSAFVSKLLGARSFDSIIQIQSEYAKTSYAEFIAYLTKIGELYPKLAKAAFKRSHVA